MAGQMYDPGIQRALLEKLARWRRLPQSDLLRMLAPEERLRYRGDALSDLEWEGLVTISTVGDEPVVAITEAGDQVAATYRTSPPPVRRPERRTNGGHRRGRGS